MIKREGDKEVAEPFAEMARFFTESRLLQRDIKLLLEGVTGSSQIVLATVIHPVSVFGGRRRGRSGKGKRRGRGRWSELLNHASC